MSEFPGVDPDKLRAAMVAVLRAAVARVEYEGQNPGAAERECKTRAHPFPECPACGLAESVCTLRELTDSAGVDIAPLLRQLF